MMDKFQEYLNAKKKNNEVIKVYLKATQSIPDRYNRESRINNLMLSGKVKDVDERVLILEDQECLIPFDSILSIKPDKS